jgi:transposase
MSKEKPQDPDFAALVGWDWADQKHEVRLLVTGSAEVERYTIDQNPEALCDWVQKLRERFGGEKVAIAIEQARGPVVYALMAYDFLVLYPINPKSLARFREALRPSKAKDDPADADLILELLAKHRDRLRPWKPEHETIRALRMLVEYRRDIVDERTRCTNRLTALLKSYFPQALGWVGDLASNQACDFLLTWPSLERVKEAGGEALREFYSKHGCKSKTIEARLGAISEAKPLTTDRAVVTASVMMVQTTMSQIRCLSEAIEEFDRRIQELFAEHPDCDLFKSFPGAGKVLAPRLSVALGADRSRYESAEELQQFSGIAPVTERSGKAIWVHRRYACPTFLHQTFFEFAAQSIVWSPWAKAFYQERKQLGQGRNAILRALAFRWIRIIYRCWIDRVPYDEQVYQDALARRGSRVARALAETASTSASTPTT